MNDVRPMLLACLVVSAMAVSGGCSSAPANPVPLSIRVVGNHFVNGAGQTIRLLGVNREGPNYMCTGGLAPSSYAPAAIFDGPSDDASITAMKAWRINAVRLPLNETCWLGINGVDPTVSGPAYQQAIKDFVARLHAQGMYAIIELYANAPGSRIAITQQTGPDADHAIDFWTSVATAFKNDPAVLFDLFNEPLFVHGAAQGAGEFTNTNPPASPAIADWDCWKSGGCSATTYDDGTQAPAPLPALTWPMTGMQQLLNAVRATGATQPVLLGGIRWTLDMSGWLGHLPNDPQNQIAASVHLYDFSGGGMYTSVYSAPRFTQDPNAAAWAQDPTLIAQQYPVVTGELGLNPTGFAANDARYLFIDKFMDWADSLGISYLMYTWVLWHQPGSSLFSIIADYQGTPTPMGTRFQLRMQQVGYP